MKKCIRFIFRKLCRVLYCKPISVLVKGVYAQLDKRFPRLAAKFTFLRERVRANTRYQEQRLKEYEAALRAAETAAKEKAETERRIAQKTQMELEQEAKEQEAREQAAREAAALQQWESLQWNEELTMDKDYTPLISVIVPNYNHAQYLEERLDSIYNQTYSNIEVILLDDCSKDNSREILMRYAEKYPEKTTVAFNETNAGKVFLQWNKGLKLAKGEYIWIAESDDYSEPTFLEKMVKCFRYNSVMLVFARSVFMQEGKQIWSTEEYLADVKTMRWDRPFTMTASTAVKLGFGYKNIIPNVSSVVFKNIGQVPDDVINVCRNMNLSSDWIFYLAVIKGGCIGYTNETTNFYRVHQESTSLRIQQTMQYYDEYEMVSRYVAENYAVEESLFQSVLKYLLWHYKATQHVQDAEIVKEHYRIELLKEVQTHRKPNIVMACFSLQSGGGETYPLYLANELHRQGNNVTVLDFNRERYEEQCHKLLDVSVPLVRMRNVGELVLCLEKLGADVIHSHHGSVDEIIGKLINASDCECKHVITLHGMYETIEDSNLKHLFDVVSKSCSKFFYIADKNLIPFKRFRMLHKVKMTKIDNGLPMIPAVPVSRAELGIGDDDFVLCLVSRGIPEKGWKEGIEAVKCARERTKRPIHLLLVGDGEIREALEKESPDYVHFMGNRNNVRDFFAASDVGFLPTRFAGESYPLVVIEAMMCGKPVIATDIAEVRHQLTDENGDLAGELLTLHKGFLHIEEITDAILKLSEDKEKYELLQKRTTSAIKKFDIAEIGNKYLQAYREVTGLIS